jgi:phosphatidylserine/phosphatidylglycerophosphate/cardiolipin synthase-like enzyme
MHVRKAPSGVPAALQLLAALFAAAVLTALPTSEPHAQPPDGFVTDFSRLNRRMHNKSFTVDNQATVVGGRNIGDEYFAAGQATSLPTWT